jgi:pilus assembly protein CpaE
MLSALTAAPQVLAGYAEGADDYVGKPVDLTVLGAKISSLLARSAGERTPEGAGRVVLFQHAKGGVGATTLLVNLACLLEPLSVTGVCLLDLKMGFGDVSRMLGVRTRLTLADLALQPVETVDDALFSKFVAEYTAGIHVVAATERPEHAELVNVPAVQMAISRLQERYQYVLVDAPAAYDERAMAALDVADLVCVVTGATSLPLRSTADLLKLLRRVDIQRGKQVLILNHNRPDGSPADAAEVLGERVDLSVPYTPEFVAADESAQPLAATDPEAEALVTLGEFAAGLADRIARSSGRPARAPAPRRAESVKD